VTKVEIVPSHPGEDVRVSATSYLTYKQCPARADARYQGHYGTASRSSFVGSLAHQVFRRHLVSGPIDEAGFEQACREEIGGSQRLNNAMRDLSMKPSDLSGVFEEVRALYQRFVRFPQEGFEGAEIAFDIAAAAGVALVGQIDAVYTGDPEGHRLVDWKTGELGEAGEQMGFYALLWMLDRKQLPVSIEAISVKTGERFSSVPVTEDVVKVAREVSHMVDDLRIHWSSGTEFERRGGPWCQYCPVLVGCSEGEATVKILENSG